MTNYGGRTLDGSEMLVARNQLCRILTRRTGDANLAEDLCDSVLARVWLRARSSGVLPPFPYIVRSGFNALHSERRRRIRSRQQPLKDGFDLAERTGDANDVTQTDQAMIAAAFDQLPPPYHEVARLRFVEGWPEWRIAEHLRRKVSTVKTHVARAKALLRQLLRSK